MLGSFSRRVRNCNSASARPRGWRVRSIKWRAASSTAKAYTLSAAAQPRRAHRGPPEPSRASSSTLRPCRPRTRRSRDAARAARRRRDTRPRSTPTLPERDTPADSPATPALGICSVARKTPNSPRIDRATTPCSERCTPRPAEGLGPDPEGRRPTPERSAESRRTARKRNVGSTCFEEGTRAPRNSGIILVGARCRTVNRNE